MLRFILFFFVASTAAAKKVSTDCGYVYDVSGLEDGDEYEFTSHRGFDGKSKYGKKEYCDVGFKVRADIHATSDIQRLKLYFSDWWWLL